MLHTRAFLVLLTVTHVACSFEQPTSGDLGNATFHYADSHQCGVLSTCPLEVPLAVNARERLLVNVPIAVDPSGDLTLSSASDAIAVTEQDTPVVSNDQHTYIFPIEAMQSGSATLTLSHPSGDVVDTVTALAAVATNLRHNLTLDAQDALPNADGAFDLAVGTRYSLTGTLSDTSGLDVYAGDSVTIDVLEGPAVLEDTFVGNLSRAQDSAFVRSDNAGTSTIRLRHAGTELDLVINFR